MHQIQHPLHIEQNIFHIRGQRVMLHRDLADLYQVPTRALNQAVRRNMDRFPEGFMFRLSPLELGELITNCDRFIPLRHSSVSPFALTEFGVAMLSSVLRSQRAIRVNIEIIRVFIRLRGMLANRKRLATQLDKLEKKVKTHDKQIHSIFNAIRELTFLPKPSKKRIGFHADEMGSALRREKRLKGIRGGGRWACSHH